VDLLVLDHHPSTGPHRFTEVLDARAGLAPWRTIDVPAGGPLPEDVEGLAGVVVMGGPQSVTEEHPWLAGELDLLRRLVAADVPVFGVCLGAQLLATALGGEVATREVPEIGFVPLHRTEEGASDELTAGWPEGAATVLWHGDEITRLPEQAVPLLRGAEQVTAWRHGSAFATQAHPEVDVAQLERWIEMDHLDHQFADSGNDPEAFLAEAARRERFLLAVGLALFGRFLDGPVRRRATGSAR
jgi:GMP synthase (glutamine-hydrolysing)